MTHDKLLEIASNARMRAYVRYSNFAVGAALLTRSGEVFQGCNVENISFGLTMCAERVAIGTAIAQGAADFVTIALSADSRLPVMPCGACRQVLAEFNADLEIVSSTKDGHRETFRLSELLPRPKQGILDRTDV